MTVHQPHTGVISLEGNDNVPLCRDQYHIAAGEVDVGELRVEIVRVKVIVVVLLYNGEVMAVKMDLIAT